MNIECRYQNNGMFFKLNNNNNRIEFPIGCSDEALFSDIRWDELNTLEQLWYSNQLFEYEDGYLLTPEQFFLLDEDVLSKLSITPYHAQIGVTEKNRIGMPNYHFEWYAIVRGRNSGKATWNAQTIRAGGFDFLLSKEQFLLISAIERGEVPCNVESQGRYFARCKSLAVKAGAKMDSFTDSRDVFYSNSTSLDIVNDGDGEISFRPVLNGIPEEIQKDLTPFYNGNSTVSINGKRNRVFSSDDATEQFREIASLPKLRGEKVPEFLENPLEYIPENIEFDPDEFSKRVKGLKIRVSSAAPYINISPKENENGWFNVDIGIAIHDVDGLFPDYTVPVNDELVRLMEDAAENGEKYVYYQNQWIKIPKDSLEKFQKATKEVDNTQKISRDTARKILDIYDNIEGIEYNETSIELKSDNGLYDLYEISNFFNGQLKDYQEIGYSFLSKHYDSQLGVLLADDMGLGKTVQVIAALARIHEMGELQPALLVMPTSLIENWQGELGKFLPDATRVYVHQGQNRYRTANTIQNYELVLTTYETLARDQTLLATIHWSCVICDEVQKIKNFRTLAANAVKGMNTSYRIAITGTPVENRLSELWSIADFAQPGLLSSYKHFRTCFEEPLQKKDENRSAITDALVEQLKPIFLRRTKEEVLSAVLPQKYEDTINIRMTSQQEMLYRDFIKKATESDENIVLATIQKLLMVCSHPRLALHKLDGVPTKTLIEESPKLSWTIEKLKEVQKTGEKAIIFTGYKSMQSTLRQVIMEIFNVDAKIINGEVTGSRLDIIRQFSATNGFGVIILSPRAAGVGLNIVAANHVIHYTREWNPAIENQATDRAYRIGQERPVNVYYPVMTSGAFLSAEEKLANLLAEKRELMKSVVIPSNLEITIDDFKDSLKIAQ